MLAHLPGILVHSISHAQHRHAAIQFYACLFDEYTIANAFGDGDSI